MTTALVADESTQHTAEVFHFRFARAGLATFIIVEALGEFSIQSDWGDYSYRWRPDPKHLGAPTLKDFLARGDADYVARKFGYEKGRDFTQRFDPEGTRDDLKRKVIEDRRAGDLDSERARELFDLIKEADFDSGPDLAIERMDHDLYLYLGEPWEYLRFSASPQFCFLVDSLLPFFFEFLRHRGFGPRRKTEAA